MIEIIPAIDIIDGKCVRLTQGDYTQKKVYNEDPLEVALQFSDVGITRLHVVDLDGAKAGAISNLNVLERLASKTSLGIDFGGGIKNQQDIERVFNAGAAMATVGSIAVKKPGIFFGWVKQFGAEKLLLGADVKNEMIAVNGWQQQTSISVFDFISANVAEGVTSIFCTDIAKDGMMQGPSVLLYEKLLQRFPGLYLIASGGVSCTDDVKALANTGCSGVIIGKAIYEQSISWAELKTLIAS